jgi:drug/metabolite transporter (DMT)-like permease
MLTKLPVETRAYGVLLLLGVLFGSAFLYIKLLLDDLTPTQLVASRLVLGAVVVLAMLAMQRDLPRLSGRLMAGGLVLAALDYVLPYALISWAQQSIDSGMTAVLISTMPLFTVLFAANVLPDERFCAAKAAGLGAGFLGAAVLAGPEALSVRDGVTLGHAAVLLAAVSYGAAGVYSRVLLRTNDVGDITGVKLALAAILAVFISAVVDGSPSGVSLGLGDLVALVMLGAVSTGLGRTAQLWVIGTLGSVRASLLTYVMPVSALFLGWAVLGEAITVSMLGGLALIVVGIALVNFGPELTRHLGAIPIGRTAARARGAISSKGYVSAMGKLFRPRRIKVPV